MSLKDEIIIMIYSLVAGTFMATLSFGLLCLLGYLIDFILGNL